MIENTWTRPPKPLQVRFRLVVLACLALVATVPGARAEDAPPGFTIDGQVGQVLHLTVADLKQMPGTQIDVSFEAKGGVEKSSFVGVSLIELLNQAKVTDGPEKGAHLRHIIEIKGRDGYTVAVAIGEIDPNLENKSILLAYLRDGQPVEPPGSVRLVVPGDRHGARSVRDVVDIEVK